METRTRHAKKIRTLDRSAFQPPREKRHRHHEGEVGVVTCLDTPGLHQQCTATAGKLREMGSVDHIQAGKRYYFEESNAQDDIHAEVRLLRAQLDVMRADLSSLRLQSADKDLRFIFKAVLTSISARVNLSYAQLVTMCQNKAWVEGTASRRLSATFNNGTTFVITSRILHVIPQMFIEYNLLSSTYIHQSSVRCIAFSLVELNKSRTPPTQRASIANELFELCFSVDPTLVVQQASAGTLNEELESFMSDS